MAAAVYVLCALTSLGCAVLLARGYLANGVRLLFWSALCFATLTVNNVLLFVDIFVVPQTDLSMARNVSALLGVAILLFGLVWEARE